VGICNFYHIVENEEMGGVLRLFACVVAGLAGSLAGAQQPASRDVLFSMNVNEKGEYFLSPLVELVEGRPFEPQVVQSDTGCRIFPSQRLAAGRSYTVLFGGERVGRATVSGSEKFNVKLNRAIRLEPRSTNRNGDTALAASSAALGRDRGTRRSPDAAERAAALEFARAEFIRRSVPAALLPRLEIVQLTSTDLNGDGRQDLIGVGAIDSGNPAGEVRTLFFVAEGTGQGYRPALRRYHSGNGETYGIEVLVDHIDLDGDGADEIVTKAYGWEWFTYRIYSRRGGAWIRTYEGYGCQGA
jgi:hypothetical protein